MNGIKMSDCRFYVNEEKRTVVCVIPETKRLLLDFIYDNMNHEDVSLSEIVTGIWNDNKFIEKLKLPRSFVGKAVCSEEDTWNEEVGRMIAFSRAKDKCYKSFFRRANLFVQTVDRRLQEAIDVFNDFGTKLEIKREALEAKIEEKIKEGDA